jgi:tetratricopeptide (TPR) repeat protein
VNDSFQVKKTINYKAILIVLGVLAALAVGVHFLHAFQVKRNAADLLQEAKLLQDEGKLNEARGYMKQYVGMVPDDVDALAQYGMLLEKSVEKLNNTKALVAPYDIYARVIVKQPDRQDILRRQSRLALRLGHFPEAKAHLSNLLKAHPDDSELNQLMARCVYVGDQNADGAAVLYQKALNSSKEPDLFLEYAKVLHDQKNNDERAWAQVEDMVRLNKDSLAALSKAAEFYMYFKEWDRAKKHLDYAIDTLKARDANVYFQADQMARGQKDYKAALAYVKKGLEVLPGDPYLTGNLAVLTRLSGDTEGARKIVNLDILRPKTQPVEKSNAAEPKPKSVETKVETAPYLYNVAELLIELNEPEKARDMIKQFGDKGDQYRTPALFLDARLAMRERSWGVARKHLEDLLKRRDSVPLVVHANLLLADCYDKLGNRDKQLQACLDALRKDPKYTPSRQAYAACLASMGKFDDAIQANKEMSEEIIPVPGVRLELARLLFMKTLRQAPEQQDWTPVEQALQRIPAEDEKKVAVKLLHADVLTAQKKYDEARKIAEEQRDRDSKEVAPWMFLVNLSTIQGNPGAAARILDEAEKKTGKQSVWAIARMGLVFNTKGKDEAKKLLPQLEAEMKDYPEADRNKMLFALADGYILVDDRPKAEKLWATVAERLPDDIYVRFRLYESALQAGHEINAQKWLDEIRKVEGPGGATALYCDAALLVLRYRNGDKTALERTAPILRELNTLRPTWSRVALLEGTVLEAQDQKEKALEKYKLARKYGESRLAVVRHIVWLLYEKGRYAEAETVMRDLPQEALASGDMKRMASNIMLLAHPEGNQQEAKARALELARKTIEDKSATYQDYVWLGLLAAASEQPAEAEKALRKAREMKPEIAGTWTPLIALLARADARKAELELREAQRVLPKSESVLVLAAGYEALGKDKLAEESYEAALAAQPSDINLLRNASGFYRRIGQPTKAEAALNRILDPATKAPDNAKAWANRNLALTLAARGGYANFQKAVKLLEANVDLIGDTDEDKRTKALVFGTQPAHRSEAIKLFESLSHNQTPTPETQFLLAQLYEADNKWYQAKPLLITLVNSQPNNSVYLTKLIGLLLRHKQADEAMSYVNKLAELKPNQPETVVLKVRTLKEVGREREARELVHTYQGSSDPSLELVAHLFEDLGMKLEAEQAFRAYAAKPDPKAKQPDVRPLALALFLGRNGKTEEALSICEQSWKTLPAGAVAATAVSVLRGGQVPENLQREAIRQIKTAIASQPGDIDLRYFLAECNDVLGRLDEAIIGYREVLKLKDSHVPALNNLAMLLALKEEKGGDALQLITKAIEMAGPIAELLDTRAMVYLNEQQPRAAMADLQEAIRLNPKPLYYFHLARAYHMNQDRLTATNWMNRATKEGLKTSALPRLEQPQFESLNRELTGS